MSTWASPAVPAEPTTPAASSDLGDTGYYYSAVSPYLQSTISVYNPNDDFSQAVLRLRNDIGTLVYTATQTLAPGEQWHFVPAAVGLHGIFHGDVSSNGGTLAVHVGVVSAEDTAAASQPQPLRAGYLAQRNSTASHSLSLGTLTVARGPASAQTEIVVQNLDGRSNQVIFTLCPADGLCFANNVAVLPAYGRRAFLLSDLAYSNRYGDGLVALTGKIEVTVNAEPDKPIALVANAFETNTTDKAELGAAELAQLDSAALSTMGSGATAEPVNGTIPQYTSRVFVPSVMGSYQPRSERTCALPGSDEQWPCGAHADVLWHLPFVAAPVVSFVEDKDARLGVGYPWQGIQGTARSLDAWAAFSNLNWYNWIANANWATYLNPTLWTLCDSDPNYFPMVWSATVARNTVPSSCAGRPLLLVNEPDLQRLSTPTWTDEAIADNVFRHHNWPGDLYCCGHVSWSGGAMENISPDASNFPTFGNILDAYQQRFGERLPIDGVHVHFYLTWADVDMARQAPHTAVMTTMRGHVRRWVSYIEDNFGNDFPILVSEYGVLTSGTNQQAARNIVKAGLDDFTAMLVDELGTNLVRLHYFQVYWGGEHDPNRPMWLVGSDDNAYALEEVNDLGEYFLNLVETHRRE